MRVTCAKSVASKTGNISKFSELRTQNLELRIAPVAHVLQISLTVLQARRRPDQMVRSPCFELPARRYRLVLFVFVTIFVLVTVLPMALMFTIFPMFPTLAPLAMHFFHLAMFLFISLDL
jgi:hypothetical protein